MVMTGRQSTALALVVAVIATIGSQYYEHGLGLYPCSLCWYQRVLMYPLIVILGDAFLTEWRGIHRRVLPFALLGVVVASYHSWLQLGSGTQCTVGGCATVQFRLVGFLTIPNQSLVAFALLSLTMGWVWWLSSVDA